MSVTLGDAILYLSANPDALNAGLKKADSRIKRFAGGAKKILGAALKTAMIGAGIAIAAGMGILVKSIQEAADAGEAMAKFDATFGAAGEGLIKTLDDLAEATGRSRFELREAAADFGAVTKALGFTEDGAADMSAAALEMAVDLGAFNNLPTEDVAKRIRKALTGETESMKELGVVISQNRIKQELLNMGIRDNVNEVAEAVKAQAIFNIIQRQTADAVGIAEEEAGSFTGQMVSLKAIWSDFMIELGTKFLPFITPIITALGEKLPLALDWVMDKVGGVISVFEYFKWQLEQGKTPLEAIQGILRALVPPELREKLDNFLEGFNLFVAWINETGIPALRTMWEWFQLHIKPVLVAIGGVLRATFNRLWGALVGIWEDLNPLIESGIGWIDGLLEPINGISGAVEKLVGWLDELAEKIRSQPDPPRWWKPGSPTPFEKGLRGIAKSIEQELNPQLGKFAAQLQATMGAGGLGGSSTQSFDQRRYFEGASLDIPSENMLDVLAKQVRRM